MAHEIDITNDIASYADSRMRADGRTDAWHRLGQTIGRTMTPDEALELAQMKGWDVRKIPLVADIRDPRATAGRPAWTPVPGKHVVVRTNPITGATEPLGVVGDWFAPFQNEATVDLLYDITEQSGAHIETIAALDGGRRTFVTMRLPDHLEFTSPVDGSRDRTDLYIAVFNHHDGGGALRAIVSPVRVVCANTQRLAEARAVSTVKLRHTGEPLMRLSEVRRLLGLTFAYRDVFAADCQRLIDREVSNIEVMDVIEQVFTPQDAAVTESARERRAKTFGAVMDVYAGSPTVAPFRGTAYGAYNAVTEYLDHFAPVLRKGADAETVRALRTIGSVDVADRKARAFELLLPTN